MMIEIYFSDAAELLVWNIYILLDIILKYLFYKFYIKIWEN